MRGSGAISSTTAKFKTPGTTQTGKYRAMNGDWSWIISGAAGLLGLFLLVAVIRRRRKTREAERPYRCLTFYLGRQEVAEDEARAREKLGANLNVAPPG